MKNAQDPAEAHRRRGAAFTFSASGYSEFIRKLKDRTTAFPLGYPTFSHSAKDPVHPSECVRPVEALPRHKVVILEGLYVNVGEEGWDEAARMLDERWLFEVPREVALERLVERHVRTGVTTDVASARIRGKGALSLTRRT